MTYLSTTVMRNASVIRKNILSALIVAAGGFVLLNLAFVGFAAVTKILEFILPFNLVPMGGWITFGVIIAGLSWVIFRSKLGTIYKAIYMTVPVAAVLVLVGILFFRWPWLAITVGGLFSGSALIYFVLAKKPWLYSFSLILVSLGLLTLTLLGVDI